MRILYVLLLLTFCLAACTKLRDEQKSKYPQPGTWKVDDNIFSKDFTRWFKDNDSLYTIVFSEDTFTASGTTNGLRLHFFKRPEGAGMYKVVSVPKANDEVSISEWQQTGGHSDSRDNLGGTIQTSVEPNGKLTFKTAGIKLEHITWVNNYNVSCSFNLTED